MAGVIPRALMVAAPRRELLPAEGERGPGLQPGCGCWAAPRSRWTLRFPMPGLGQVSRRFGPVESSFYRAYPLSVLQGRCSCLGPASPPVKVLHQRVSGMCLILLVSAICQRADPRL